MDEHPGDTKQKLDTEDSQPPEISLANPPSCRFRNVSRPRQFPPWETLTIPNESSCRLNRSAISQAPSLPAVHSDLSSHLNNRKPRHIPTHQLNTARHMDGRGAPTKQRHALRRMFATPVSKSFFFTTFRDRSEYLEKRFSAAKNSLQQLIRRSYSSLTRKQSNRLARDFPFHYSPPRA